MDSWNEPISFAPDGKPNDPLSNYEAKKEKLKKAPLQINNDGSVTPLNQDGSPLDGSPYERPEMSEESEGWKLKDKNAFNGKYDDVMDLDGNPTNLKGLAKGFVKGYSVSPGSIIQDEVKDWGYSYQNPKEEYKTFPFNNTSSAIPGKLVVEKIMPDGSLLHEKTYEPGEIVALTVDHETIDFSGDAGFMAISYQGKTIYTIKTAHGFDKYSYPPFKMTYSTPVKEKAPEPEIDEALAVADELPEKESPKSWAQGYSSKEIVDQIVQAKKLAEKQYSMSHQGYKAMSFATTYGTGVQKQAEIYKKFLASQFISPSPDLTHDVPDWDAGFMPLELPAVNPSEDEEESDDDDLSPDEELYPKPF